MAFSAYCKVDGIEGECTEEGHKNWIEIRSFNHGARQAGAGSVSESGSLSAGAVDHDLFTMIKALDKSSPKLAIACSRGDHIKEIKIELWRSIGKNRKFMEYKLTNAMIRSVCPGGGAKSGEDIPLEEVSLAYERIDWTYTEHDNTGNPKGNVAHYFDLSKRAGG